MQRLKSLVPLAYPTVLFAVAWASIAFSSGASPFAAVWPANALTLAVLVRWAHTPRQRAYTLIYFVLVIAAANLVAGVDAPLALGMTVCNFAEVVIAVRLLRGASDPIASLRAFMRFLAGAVLAAPVLAGLGAAAIWTLLSPGVSFVPTFARWVIADSLGMAIIGSLLLTVGRPRATAAQPGELWRFLGAQGLLTMACIPVLVLSEKPPLGVIFPLVILAAISHRQLGAVTGVAIFTVFTVLGSVAGRGVAGIATMAGYEPLIITQLVVASMAFSVLPIAALLRRLDEAAVEAEAARFRAEELNEIKTRLLAHVSHEIRSPLTGVTTLAELMRDGALGELTASQRESVEQIAKSGATVAALARDLVDAAAIQTGKATIKLEAVRAGEAIRSASALAGFRAAEYGAIIQVADGEADEAIVWADPLRLRQILVNLLVNGAKYGGGPPKVRIAARRASGGTVRFMVEDNGKGFEAGSELRLFKDFDRLGAERVDLDGAGLGLALSQEMAKLQNGRLGVDRRGSLGGACVWLELPLARREDAAA